MGGEIKSVIVEYINYNYVQFSGNGSNISGKEMALECLK